MDFFIGVTDPSWFKFLSAINPEDVNFWQPSGRTSFKAIPTGAPFLFKLRKPFNVIAGLGFFSTHSFLPISLAWEIFERRNGVATYSALRETIQSIRGRSNNLLTNPTIGCIVLTNPIFFNEEDWINIPPTWSPNIVQGKSYSTQELTGKNLWDEVENTLAKYLTNDPSVGAKSQLVLEDPQTHYGKSVLTKVRLGQGAFRVMLTDAYLRKCAISGEKTLPVLEAAHIKPYAESGPHFISNGLLLRSDLHKLFDSGYITVTDEFRVEVSYKIKEEFENGREYYKFQGASLMVLPDQTKYKPSLEYLRWHNTNRYNG
jgi:putative restriction endonuclease